MDTQLEKKEFNSIPKPKQSKIDNGSKIIITLITCVVILMLVALLCFIVYNSSEVFRKIGFFHFIFDSWNPGSNKSAQDGTSTFGIGKIIVSTVVLLLYSLIICIPITIFASLFIAEYLSKKAKRLVIIFVQLLAGIPSIVFGLFALNQIGSITTMLGAQTNGNLTTAAITLAFMALPTMITLSVSAIENVPDGYRWGSLAIGITKERTTMRIVFVSALPGIISAIVMGIARIIGETMAIILIAGNSANGVVWNNGFGHFIFSSIRTLAGTIGLEMLENSGSIHQSALYAIGLILFILVIVINLIVIFIGRNKKCKTSSKASKENSDEETKYVYVFSKNQLRDLVTYNSKRTAFKKFESIIVQLCLWLSTLIIIAFVVWILGSLLINGIEGWSWSNFSMIEGQKSGIGSSILTTLLLVFLTIVIAIPIALISAIYLAEYAPKDSKFVSVVRFAISVLSSTPSIVFGVLGLTLFIQVMNMGMSILTGALTMTFVVLSPLIINFEDAIKSIPQDNKEAAYGMGLKKISVIFKIVIPCAMKDLFTGMVLAISKIIGEAAPVYLTLGTVVRLPANGFLSPGSTLTTVIYMLTTESSSSTSTGDAYQISLVLVFFVLFINFFGDILANKIEYKVRRRMSFKMKMNIIKTRIQNLQTLKSIFRVTKNSSIKLIKQFNKVKNIPSSIKLRKENNQKIKEIYKKAKKEKKHGREKK